MKRNGFSLIELIVVLALVMIVGAIASLDFSSWQRKYNIEAQTKEMLTDLSEVRLMAIHTKKQHRVVLNPTSIVFQRFSSEADTNGTQVFNKTLNYPIQQFSSGTLSAFSNTAINMNSRGYTSDFLTIAVGAGLGGSPAFNCLAVHWARVNMGRINGNSCDFQ